LQFENIATKMQPFMILWLNFPLNKRISAFQVLSPRPKGLPNGSPYFLPKIAKNRIK